MFINFYFLRCELVEQSLQREEFLKILTDDLPAVLKHDFLTRSQASHFREVRNTLKEGDFIISLDFSENYTCQVQDAIQSQHWANIQSTLHPYVVYYRENNTTKSLSYVIISENLHHNASSVHFFNCKLIAHLKRKFGSENIKNVSYFSDGAASQYKNKFNLINLMKHEQDFGIKAQWNFFATSHGKGACDGIGGTVKRHAFKSSLQNKQITTPKLLFEWAKNFFKKIDFDFCTNEEQIAHNETLKARFEVAQTVKNTRQYHSFTPIDNKRIACKIFSESTKYVCEYVVNKKAQL